MKKIFALAVAVILVTGILLTGCSGAAPKTSEKFVVGLDDAFPPMGFKDESGKIVGFDVDMAKEAAKRMGMEVEFKAIDWDSKVLELNGEKIDVIWNGLTINDKRKKEVLFSEPYLENKQIIVVTEGSTIKTKADLKDKMVGVQSASSSIDALEKDEATLKTLKEVKQYGDNTQALMDLEAGRIDAVVVDEVVGRFYIAKKPGKFAILEDHFGSEEYGVGFRLKDTEFRDKLQNALNEMKKDGASAEISKAWFGEDVVK
ncbi:amino acid ABC transporter substrate-binding protein [Petroclostridium sp. X23]|uniref:amino acid ABC transporter substrate-binding protein n=1 Tax=Petroclostridium sp. X23 TaxID=3045146 RepID=UPI0024ACE88D|nr:amino acid ABC transporter substrate-binding protein [Petroclostridium sp. X23]WHH58123.1 amino acid ABC transporter substrate-binding protein [Petroclostridium sp. X23]